MGERFIQVDELSSTVKMQFSKLLHCIFTVDESESTWISVGAFTSRSSTFYRSVQLVITRPRTDVRISAALIKINHQVG